MYTIVVVQQVHLLGALWVLARGLAPVNCNASVWDESISSGCCNVVLAVIIDAMCMYIQTRKTQRGKESTISLCALCYVFATSVSMQKCASATSGMGASVQACVHNSTTIATAAAAVTLAAAVQQHVPWVLDADLTISLVGSLWELWCVCPLVHALTHSTTWARLIVVATVQAKGLVIVSAVVAAVALAVSITVDQACWVGFGFALWCLLLVLYALNICACYPGVAKSNAGDAGQYSGTERGCGYHDLAAVLQWRGVEAQERRSETD
jgi:hypothetical protein